MLRSNGTKISVFKIAMLATILVAAFVQFGHPVFAKQNAINVLTLSDEAKINLAETDSEALAAALNAIEPSN